MMRRCACSVGGLVITLLLCCHQQLGAAEVIDLTHLMDDTDVPTVVAADEVSANKRQEESASIGLARQIVALEEQLRHREDQILDLKRALEEVTTEFERRVAEVRSQRESVASVERSQLREELREKSAALAAMQQKQTALRTSHDAVLVEQAHALRTAQAAEVRDVRDAHAAEVAALVSTFESETSALLEQVENESAATHTRYQEEISGLRSKHEADVSALQQAHAEEIESLRRSHASEMGALTRAHSGAIASLHTSHEAAMTVLRKDHENELAAVREQLANMRGEMAAVRASYADSVASLRSDYEREMAAVRSEQENERSHFATFRAEAMRDREVLAKLRSEVTRLDEALQRAQTENTRERFLLAYNSGSLFLAARRYDRAEQDFLKALSIQEDDAPLHYNLGVLYDEHLRQPSKARRHYERFLALAPNDRDAPLVMQWLQELR